MWLHLASVSGLKVALRPKTLEAEPHIFSISPCFLFLFFFSVLSCHILCKLLNVTTLPNHRRLIGTHKEVISFLQSCIELERE